MTATPTVHTFAAGEVATAANINLFGTAINFAMAPPICQAYSSAAQSIPNNSFTSLTMNTEDVDSSGMHSTSSNTSRFTAVYPGWYQCSAGVSFASNATGRRGGRWFVNGTTAPNGGQTLYAPPTSVPEVVFRNMLIFLNVADYVEAQAFQDSGGALLTIVANVYDYPNVTIQWRSN